MYSGQTVFGQEIVSKIPDLIQKKENFDYSVCEINEKEKEKYLNELKNKIDSLSDEEKERLNVGTYDESNVAIKRELGKWRFIGKILPKNMNEDGEEFNIGILPEKRFINYNTMYISWKDLKSELGLFKDAFISPLGKIALITSSSLGSNEY